MKKFVLFTTILLTNWLSAQNISVDATTYTPQELVEDILINNGCIENVSVTNTVSAFTNNDKSFGYFNRNGSNFPYEEGIVMSTGRLSNVPGPNNSLSDDDANNWGGDADLENVLNTNNTLNATVIEFDFTPNANSIQFNYIFASEEYQEGDSSTCIYSDVFAFLIKPIGGNYQNIAVVPGTTIPVKVTTVHPEIPGECPAENEQYFGSFNGSNVPINFNGQTVSLTAQTTVTPNTSYHIKLVIADHQNYRYDSAVFLEGGSFDIGADLGPDYIDSSALCEGETQVIQPLNTGNAAENYSWYRVENTNETLLTSGPNETQYTVTESGTYKVVIDYGNACTVEDSIVVEYVDFSSLDNESLSTCDLDGDGFSSFNLNNAIQSLTNGEPQFSITDFFLSETDATNNQNPIPNPGSFDNTVADQVVYARVETANACFSVLELSLTTSESTNDPIDFITCSENGESFFDFAEIISLIQDETGSINNNINFYNSSDDAASQSNTLGQSLSLSHEQLPKQIFARIGSNDCEGIVPINLQSLLPPQIDANKTQQSFCLNVDSELEIEAPVLGNPNDYSFTWENGQTGYRIAVDSIGTYSVDILKTEIINGNEYTCSTTSSVSISQSEKASIDYSLEGELGNFSVRILAQGMGDYVYALDSTFSFQDHPVFPVEAGEHTLYVKDRKGCGIASLNITVIDYMRFFTPNNDGYNDFWKIKNISRNHNLIKEIFIFDRYGKLIKAMTAFDAWDGTFQGKNLPSDDYWFKISLKNGQDFKGHFTLLR